MTTINIRDLSVTPNVSSYALSWYCFWSEEPLTWDLPSHSTLLLVMSTGLCRKSLELSHLHTWKSVLSDHHLPAPPPLGLWQPPLSSLLWVGLFYLPHLSEIMKCLSFCVWPISRCIEMLEFQDTWSCPQLKLTQFSELETFSKLLVWCVCQQQQNRNSCRAAMESVLQEAHSRALFSPRISASALWPRALPAHHVCFRGGGHTSVSSVQGSVCCSWLLLASITVLFCSAIMNTQQLVNMKSHTKP